ncbi:MAG: ABC transporter ATP-binding protein [Anaerolineales bacterium]|nr:ABC transporter ATP-binding protein [Anaerolineales bacterium]
MGFHGGGWWGYLSASDEKPQVTWALLRRVLNYSRPYRWHILGMLLAITVSTGLTLITPLILRTLIDQTIPQKNLPQLVLLASGLLVIPALGGLINVFQRRMNAIVGEGVIYDLRVALFARLQRMSLRFFTNTRVGELMSRLNNDVVGAQNAISSTIVGIVTNIIQATAVIIVMLGLEWRLTVISVLILPLFILAARKMGARLRDIARQAMDANAQMNAMMNETLNIGGALLVKLFGRTDLEAERFKGRVSNVREIGINRAVLGTFFFVIIGLLSAVGTALVYGVGGYLVIQDVFTIGTIVAFGAYLTSLYSSLQGLANAPVEFATSIVSFERVFEVIDLPREIEEKPGALELREVRGELEFDQVSFRYDLDTLPLLSQVERHGSMSSVTAVFSGAVGEVKQARGDKSGGVNGDGKSSEKPVQEMRSEAEEADEPRSQARLNALEDISFKVHPGQLVALVGPSGAGKTTLTYLIPRLYDPSHGRIYIDGHDLRDATLDSLSSQIGMVTQETHLFHDTIRTNLLYAKLDATQLELEAACRSANIHDFISELSDGYDTVVGERGYRLSGGEKQRLALARVILKNPAILVLDEATSHLDSESELLIQEALKHIMAGRTSIVIAHRLSTILAADLILVMDRGRIVERGAHHELLQLNGIYTSLYETQFNRQGEARS